MVVCLFQDFSIIVLVLVMVREIGNLDLKEHRQ